MVLYFTSTNFISVYCLLLPKIGSLTATIHPLPLMLRCSTYNLVLYKVTVICGRYVCLSFGTPDSSIFKINHHVKNEIVKPVLRGHLY